MYLVPDGRRRKTGWKRREVPPVMLTALQVRRVWKMFCKERRKRTNDLAGGVHCMLQHRTAGGSAASIPQSDAASKKYYQCPLLKSTTISLVFLKVREKIVIFALLNYGSHSCSSLPRCYW